MFSYGDLCAQNCNVELTITEVLCTSDTITISNPTLSSVNDYSFNNIPNDITGGTLIIYAQGDLDNNYENWDIFDENGNNIGSIGGTGAPCDLLMIEIPLSDIDLINWGANGSIDFQAIDVSGTDINTALCGDDFVQFVLQICSPPDCNGTEVLLQAIGGGSTTVVFNEDFDSGYGSSWLNQPPGVLTNPCDPSVDGGDYLWVGGGVSPRNVTTQPLDLSCGGEICFYLDFAIQGENPPCEGSDLSTEGVYLEYSTDGGSAWTTIEYYGPAGVGNYTDPDGYDPIMTTWNQFCIEVPTGAYTPTTLIRWSQASASTIDNDQWGLDNVLILANNYCEPYTYNWSHMSGSDNPSITIDTTNNTYTYVITYSNGIETCYDSATVIVPDGIFVDAGIDGLICDGIGSIQLGGSPTASGGFSGAYNYNWLPVDGLNNSTSSNPNASPLVTTTYTVEVTDGNGCSNIDDVTVYVGDSPSISAGDDEIICQGGQVQLTASGGVNYTWSPVQYLDNDTVSSVIATPDVTTNFIVTGYSAEGCSSSDAVLVTVEPGPTISAGSDVTICEGESIVLNASGDAGTTFTWNNGVQNGISFQPTVTDEYILTGTSANGCQSFDTITVTVNQAPTVNFVNESVCQGENVNLNVFGANSYVWSPGTYLNQTTGSSVQCTPDYGIIYQVIGYDNAGCSDTIYLEVEVTPSPDPFISGTMTYCIGGQGELTTSQTYESYLWSTGSTNQTVIVTEADNPISVTVTNTYGCAGSATAVNVIEDTVIITDNYYEICDGDQVLIHGVWQNSAGLYIDTITTSSSCDSISRVQLIVIPFAPVNAGSDISLCYGDLYTPNGSGGFNLNWNNGLIEGQSIVPTVGTHLYVLSGENEIGCISTDTVIVTVNPLPIISAGSDISICQGDSIALNGSGASLLIWDNGIPDGQSFEPNPGIYVNVLTGTDLNGCSNTDFMILEVNELPFIYAGTDINTCSGDDVTLTGSGGISYEWSNGVIDGESFVPTFSGEFIVSGTDLKGCSNEDTLILTILESPVAAIQIDEISGCSPLVVELQNTSQGNNFVNCQWEIEGYGTINSCQNQIVSFDNPGQYDVSLLVSNDAGCSSEFLYEDAVEVYDLPDVAFYPSTYSVSTLNTEVEFYNLSVGAISYLWNFNDGSLPTSVHSPIHTFPDTEDSVYYVQLVGTSSLGCSDTMVIGISVYEEVIFYVPNSFTPDNDAFNETFQPVFTSGFDPMDFNMYIYNRWGQLIFESHDASKGWKGTYGYGDRMVPSGTYTWIIRFKATSGDDHREVEGHVNVLR